jgi:hypothetical protein
MSMQTAFIGSGDSYIARLIHGPGPRVSYYDKI